MIELFYASSPDVYRILILVEAPGALDASSAVGRQADDAGIPAPMTPGPRQRPFNLMPA